MTDPLKIDSRQKSPFKEKLMNIDIAAVDYEARQLWPWKKMPWKFWNHATWP